MSRVACREASSDDLADTLRLYARPAVDDGDVLSVAEAESVLARIRQYSDCTLHLADDDGWVVGSFSLLIMGNLAHRGASAEPPRTSANRPVGATPAVASHKPPYVLEPPGVTRNRVHVGRTTFHSARCK